ncbi:MAG: T9SS type A sorting domain-containing protein [Bacteroidetes bacterium]|nr:T9SS type A sorting domain-containing protein [Bacteroidota bacterium]
MADASGVVSIEEKSKSTADDYLGQNFPNPFSSFATISYKLSSNLGEIIITDLLGKIVKKYPLTNNVGQIVISGDFHSGTYFYSLCEEGVMVYKNRMIVIK